MGKKALEIAKAIVTGVLRDDRKEVEALARQPTGCWDQQRPIREERKIK
jgi:hypothetical protein